jgi:polysaccharide biosynthesis protein PslH
VSILFLSPWFPFPPNNGSKLRIYSLLRGLASQYPISLISFTRRGDQISTIELENICKDVFVISHKPYNPISISSLLGLFSSKPRSLVDTNEKLFAKQIFKQLSIIKYKLVVASQWETASYFQSFSEIPAIFEELEIGAFENKIYFFSSFLKKLRHRMTLIKLHNYLRWLVIHFSACTVVSAQEKEFFQRIVPDYKPINIIPNFVDLANYTSWNESLRSDTLIYTGSLTYSANYDAMVWFLREIFPIIQKQVPRIRLIITGDHANLPLPQTDNVILTGYVKDVHPLITSSLVSLAPIRQGGGTRMKILESMALRTPIVATTKGAEGIEYQDSENILIADSPLAFAEAVISIVNNPTLRKRLADNSYQLVKEKYDYKVVMPNFLNLVEQIIHS